MEQIVVDRKTKWIFRLVGSLAEEINRLPREDKAELALLFYRLADQSDDTRSLDGEESTSLQLGQGSEESFEARHPSDDVASIARFPEENPNPVLRISLDGMILYSNRAGESLLNDWNCEVGKPTNPFWQDVITQVRQDGQRQMVDVQCGPKTYSFDVVPIIDTGYVNLYGRDITDRERAVRELAYQALILENVHDAVVATDAQRIITAWNRGAELLYGWSAEEVVGRPVAEIIPAEWTPEQSQAALRDLLEKGSFQGSMVQYARDGRKLWVECHGIALRDAGGQVLGFVSANRDITDRQRTEEALRESEARYRRLVEGSAEGIWTVDPDGQTDFINARGAKILGYSPEEMIGKPATQFLFDEDVSMGEERLENRKNGASEFIDIRMRHRDGRAIWVTTSTTPIYGEDGDYRGALVLFFDTTREREAKRAMLETQDRLRIALENIPLTIYTLDSDLRVNWVYHPQQGFTPEMVLGKRPGEIFPTDNIAELTGLMRVVLEEGKGKRSIFRVTINNKPLVYDNTIEPIRNDRGDVTGLTVASLDITDRMLIEEKIQYRERLTQVQHRLLDQREQERMQIARDLHDGPLQELIAATYAIQSLMANSPEEVKESLIEVRASLQNQIQELRTYASILRPPTLHKLGLEKTIRSHMDEFTQKHPDIQVHLEMKQSGELLPEAIRLAFFRIYQEALNNIVRHARASRITVRFHKTRTEASIWIQDDGIGFNPPKSLFELASRGHLGLLGIQERVDAIGGKLQVTSMPGQGTSILVSVPITNEREPDRK